MTDTRYVPYNDQVEEIEADEQETFDKIVEAMMTGEKATRAKYGRAVRTSHAKAHGFLKGELRVLDNLPPELRQGLFAVPRTYPVLLRLAHVPGEILDDRKVSTPRGLSMKVFNVDGPMLAGHDNESTTQDWVLDTGKVFNVPGAKSFLLQITQVESLAPRLPEGVKAAVSSVSRVTNEALNAVGINSPNLDFFGHPFTHPLGEPYYSQLPIRYGDYIAKLRVSPSPQVVGLVGTDELEFQDENGLRTVTTEYFRSYPAEFDVAVQLCTDLEKMPVENGHAEWSEEDSPYQTVATLTLPPQDAYSSTRQSFVDENLMFCPSHSLAAHRPLGSLMRARMYVYEVMGKHRRATNNRPALEPADIAEIPD